MGMFKCFKNDVLDQKVYAPVNGTYRFLESLNDGMFSEKMLGDGVVIEPTDGHLIAPIDGQITVVFETGHAYGIQGENGIELLIHIGIDTVNMNGLGFQPLVKVGQKVKIGDSLAEIDLNAIQSAGYQDSVIIICTNGKSIKYLLEEESLVKVKEAICVLE